jgi:hypothetical protein
MNEQHEADLRMALDKGFISQHEVEALRERARSQARPPLELLYEQGLISEQTQAVL